MTKQQRNDYLKIWREKNREKLRIEQRIWYSKNKGRKEVQQKRKVYWKNWYERNLERNKERGKLWRKNNPEKVRANNLRWNKNNPEKYKKMRKKELINVNSKIASYMRTRVRLAILAQNTWKRGKTLELLGCSILELKVYLQKKFQKDMSWDNYGEWHIDHIRPCSLFDLIDIEQQKKCFHYSNLQPLWKLDNLKKSNSFNGKK